MRKQADWEGGGFRPRSKAQWKAQLSKPRKVPSKPRKPVENVNRTVEEDPGTGAVEKHGHVTPGERCS